MPIDRPSEHDLQSQDIQLDSKDRIAGRPGRYRINIDPVIKGICKIKLLSFNGNLKAYNVPIASQFTIKSYTPGVGLVVITNYNQIIPEGSWKLMDLLTLLNMNPLVELSYNPQSGRVIVTRLATTLTTTQIEGNDLVATNPIIGKLIGFPTGFSLAPGVLAVQSVFMVPLMSLPQSILIGFDNWPSGVVTSGQKTGTFTVPIDSDTFDVEKSLITYRDRSDFSQLSWVNNLTLENIGVHILDANLGSPMIDIGEHIMIIRVYYKGNTV